MEFGGLRAQGGGAGAVIRRHGQVVERVIGESRAAVRGVRRLRLPAEAVVVEGGRVGRSVGVLVSHAGLWAAEVVMPDGAVEAI